MTRWQSKEQWPSLRTSGICCSSNHLTHGPLTPLLGQLWGQD
jgi:hypothetical protein